MRTSAVSILKLLDWARERVEKRALATRTVVCIFASES